MTVGLSVVFQEVGAKWFHAERANEMIRVVLLAESGHQRARDGASAVSTNGNALLFQKVHFTVG